MKDTKYLIRRRIENAVVWLLYLTAFLILAGSFFPHGDRSIIRSNFLEISRMFQRMIALCILLTAYHLKKRENAAWLLSVGMLLAALGVQIWSWRNTPQIIPAIFECVAVGILLAFHGDYVRPSGPSRRKERLAVPLLLIAFLALNTLTGYWMLASAGGHVFRFSKVVGNIAMLLTGQYHGPYFSPGKLLYEDIVVWFDWIVLILLLMLLLKPTILDRRRDVRQRDQVLELLRQYAVNSMSYLALESDKSWFFSTEVEGVIAYAISRDTMVLCGDPICGREDLPAFLRELKTYADRNNYNLVFLFAEARYLEIYRSMGFGTQKCGEEAVFHLADYTLQGGKVAKVRAAINHARKAGLHVEEYDPRKKRQAPVEQAFQEITEAWLRQKHTSELKFALGGVGFDYPNDKRYFYALDEQGTMQGFLVMLPYLGGKGYMADVTRHRPGGPYGVMELLFYDAFMQLRDEGVEYGSLGIAPLANVDAEEEHSLTSSLLHRIYEDMNCIYGFKPLHHAKEKFAPSAWIPAYLAFFPRHLTPAMGYATVNVMDTQGFSDYVRAWFQNHKKKKAEP